MPTPHLNGIPQPPGLGEANDDPLLQILRRHLGGDGPSTKLFYDWGNEIRTGKYRDTGKPIQNLKEYRDAWKQALHQAIYNARIGDYGDE